MKTKFSSIVKVKEQKLKDVEASLAKARGEVNRAKAAIDKVVEEIRDLKLPQRGHISMLQLANMSLVHLQETKKQKTLFLEVCEKRVNDLLIAYKQAHTDFEKMKHLHDVEVEKQLKKIKELEQKELDEMSVMLFNLQKKEIEV